ncbi:MAG: DNA gyrase inhibitor YacG [Terriglobia bacterium]
MRCPICKQSVAWEGNPFRPFCSERCKLIDLDNWFDGRYRIPARLDPDQETAPEDITTDTKGERD